MGRAIMLLNLHSLTVREGGNGPAFFGLHSTRSKLATRPVQFHQHGLLCCAAQVRSRTCFQVWQLLWSRVSSIVCYMPPRGVCVCRGGVSILTLSHPQRQLTVPVNGVNSTVLLRGYSDPTFLSFVASEGQSQHVSMLQLLRGRALCW